MATDLPILESEGQDPADSALGRSPLCVTWRPRCILMPLVVRWVSFLWNGLAW